MQQLADLTAKPVDQGRRRFDGEADQVDDRVGVEAGNSVPESAFNVFLLPVGDDLPDVLPFAWFAVRDAGSTADIDDVVARTYQTGDKEGTNVTTAANDDDLHAAAS